MRPQTFKSVIPLEAPAGSVYLISGPSRVTMQKGAADAVGKPIVEKDSVYIPENKKIPFEFEERSSVRIESDLAEPAERLPERTIPQSWDDLVHRIFHDQSRVVVVLGEMDSGKTFFSTYLANRLLALRRKAAVLDCDAGQSDVGPPCTFGLSYLREPLLFLHDAPVDALYFLGSHSPGLHLVHALIGVRQLTWHALKHADTIIVDTTGWVVGDGGRLLKGAKLDILLPDIVVLLQRERELEHLVRGRPDHRIVRIKISKKAAPTSPDVRKALRENLSKKYFVDASLREIPMDPVIFYRAFLFSGQPIVINHPAVLWAERLPAYEGTLLVVKRPLTPKDRAQLSEKFGPALRVIPSGLEKGVLVGLLGDKQHCLGMGILDVLDFEHRKIRLFTPVPDHSSIRGIVIGSVRYNTDGTEAGFVEPGTF
ncbi:hypothetical protein HY522_01860 [bacterium]|nr:hypothetical protein [bacterium]